MVIGPFLHYSVPFWSCFSFFCSVYITLLTIIILLDVKFILASIISVTSHLQDKQVTTKSLKLVRKPMNTCHDCPVASHCMFWQVPAHFSDKFPCYSSIMHLL